MSGVASTLEKMGTDIGFQWLLRGQTTGDGGIWLKCIIRVLHDDISLRSTLQIEDDGVGIYTARSLWTMTTNFSNKHTF